MSVTLTKGGNVNLTKTAPSLTRIKFALGWDARSTDGADFDLDASAFLLTAGDKTRSEDDFVFYNHLTTKDGSVVHSGDNLTGGAEDDDEVISVDLDKLPAEIEKIAFVVTIYEAQKRKQNFGQVSRAFIRLVDAANDVEVARYDLSEDASTETAVSFGELYRNGGDWKFRATGQGYAGGLAGFVELYGLHANA